MKKTDWKFLIDALLFICIVVMAFIGFLMGLGLGRGSNVPESSKYFLGLHRHEWGDIHFYFSIAFTILLFIHLILSWSWIKGKARMIFKRGWAISLILLAVAPILLLLFIWSFYPHSRAELKEPYNDLSINITGQMTLLDIEKATGVSAQQIAAKLGLPPQVSFNERLSQLRRKYSFTMKQVKDITISLMKEGRK